MLRNYGQKYKICNSIISFKKKRKVCLTAQKLPGTFKLCKTSSTHVFQQLYASLGSRRTVHLFLRLLYCYMCPAKHMQFWKCVHCDVTKRLPCFCRFPNRCKHQQSVSLSRMPAPSGYCFLLVAPNIGLSVVFLFPSEVAHLKVNNGDDGAHKLHTYCE